MNVSYFLQIALGNIGILFGLFICYFPMFSVLRYPLRKILTLGIPICSCAILIATLFVYQTGMHVSMILFSILPFLFLLYRKTVKVSFIKALTIFFMVISINCFISLYTVIISALMQYAQFYTDYAWESSVFVFFMCIGTCALVYTPATVHIRWLIENYHVSYLWQQYLIISITFTGISIVITPHYYSYLSTDRFFYPYLLIVTALLLCMIYLYCMLYQTARKNTNIHSLEMRNQFLTFQSMQYHSLMEYIESTKRLRHDFRQQIVTIQNLAETGDLDTLRNYLGKYQFSALTGQKILCANPAVNAIASHYKDYCIENEIPISWALNLPKMLPIPEPEYCVMLGNLVENAIDATYLLEKENRNISVISHMPTSSILILIVENTHQTLIQEMKKSFRSSKHEHEAIGLVSVKQTVEHYHGDIQIDYDDNFFTVNILLNIGKN